MKSTYLNLQPSLSCTLGHMNINREFLTSLIYRQHLKSDDKDKREIYKTPYHELKTEVGTRNLKTWFLEHASSEDKTLNENQFLNFCRKLTDLSDWEILEVLDIFGEFLVYFFEGVFPKIDRFNHLQGFFVSISIFLLRSPTSRLYCVARVLLVGCLVYCTRQFP